MLHLQPPLPFQEPLIDVSEHDKKIGLTIVLRSVSIFTPFLRIYPSTQLISRVSPPPTYSDDFKDLSLGQTVWIVHAHPSINSRHYNRPTLFIVGIKVDDFQLPTELDLVSYERKTG